MSARALVAVALLLPLAIGGCSHQDSKSVVQATTPHSADRPAGHVPVGPGPSGTYIVQQQPAPGGCHYRKTGDGQPLPDPACTPGAVNPKVSANTIADTICRSGYTSSIRPPANVTDREKDANAKSYAFTGPLRDAEYDHLVSLELGGDPDDPRNLWVEPPSPGHRSGSGPTNPKDTVENRLHSLVCGGKVALTAAQDAIATDWTTALATVGHPDGK
ncbi:hypothetical protein [Nocardia terpenica]|uniref:DUF3558 domain-containing protein n=1 Tax=Nocardia terpenica TaxID=455432 RepID=A0A164MAM5_9NOCA|nr:hypothetical protein [Nocardia terpenica]KZM73193.1 hypothetical protein AWN90_31390 [Nocardia terpenica]NQE91819.1 hypothetical protein [Nocardia terpenica]